MAQDGSFPALNFGTTTVVYIFTKNYPWVTIWKLPLINTTAYAMAISGVLPNVIVVAC